jgi:hypothetical protein
MFRSILKAIFFLQNVPGNSVKVEQLEVDNIRGGYFEWL